MKQNQIKNLRISMGLNQTQFGEVLGVSREWANKLENGKETPTKTMVSLMRFLKKNISK